MDAAWIGVIGALGGAAISLLGNIVNNRYLLWKESEARVWEENKNKNDKEIKLQTDKFKVYNAVLKEDGEHEYIRETEESYLQLKVFDKKRYVDKMRPILMSDLHLLSNTVFLLVRKLDSYTYDDLNYIESDEWSDDMSKDYAELINEIENEYKRQM
ncbi:hypothetical protein [Paenibacillus odorifer]|uniref:hypothetical protein n=1 Tax=Paenibacillus odorifer TaxID=189426 RepID=UPI00096C6A21|nr:hypothetical protein [Paenibacillus odorifer]OMD74160.1 hypothetical protein BSK50_21270 [Paenibacillus odorifer]